MQKIICARLWNKTWGGQGSPKIHKFLKVVRNYLRKVNPLIKEGSKRP